ncbi:hypothetical protein RY831_15685 [Noviherbaspirillum sp. CPCC 100848]|uniref:Uncharacterized protein n=1 Tax=Noviherbaspirillum album TaxID=3080276 RepID=A0ABU6JAD3_9BURK|nr:hypothetical protein [Noviherbaspirillum sp. CPCC 100848]MEC4720605.1 hypothetical protein [Noviherbaspirillum sp. CPCC 100848]
MRWFSVVLPGAGCLRRIRDLHAMQIRVCRNDAQGGKKLAAGSALVKNAMLYAWEIFSSRSQAVVLAVYFMRRL